MLQNSLQIPMNSNSMIINPPNLSISNPNVNVPNFFGPINCPANQNMNNMNNMMNLNPHSMGFMNNNQNLMNNQNYNMNNNINNNLVLNNNMNMGLNNNMNMNMGLNNNMNMALNNNNMNMINIPSMNNGLQNMNMNQNINNINNIPIQNMNMMTNQVNNPNFNNNNLLNFTGSLYNPPKGYQVSSSTRLILNNCKIDRGRLISNNGIIITPAIQCGLCLDLVMTPVECENCSKLFCKECIDNWLKQKNECPFKHQFKKMENIDLWAQQVFAKLFLKCPYKGCLNDYAYKNWMNHVKNCPMKNSGIKDLINNNNEEEVKDVFLWENIQFFVLTLQGHNLVFNLPLSTTVKELKEKLEEKTPIKASEQRLELNGKTMEDSKMLYYYNLQPNNTVHQLVRMKGGL